MHEAAFSIVARAIGLDSHKFTVIILLVWVRFSVQLADFAAHLHLLK